MFTRKALNNLLADVIKELIQQDAAPRRIILFGSYAKGNVHAYSDVDVAVWSERFTGNPIEDFEIVLPIVKKYPHVSFKLYPAGATAYNYDPFIEIIEQTGICIYEQEKQT